MSAGRRRVVVTGAASGIGQAVARLFRAAGDHVTGIDIRDPGVAADEWIAFDLDRPGEVPAVAGPVHALVNAAGLPPRPDDEARVLRVNFLGLKRVTLGLLAQMPTGAAIVNMASKAGSNWRTNIAQVSRLMACADDDRLEDFVQGEKIGTFRAYDLSKEAVIAWTKAMTVPLLARGLRMNTVSPAAVETPILGDFVAAFGERATRGIALTGRSGSAEEVAEVIRFLASPASGWIKGADMQADGGLTAQLECEALGVARPDF